ncbi:hypothetical protein KY343_06170 [Candidatus Woesearchaeota archaeon]|nr:hypothetical protein [Candidatus Woesearchaeota archaeon]
MEIIDISSVDHGKFCAEFGKRVSLEDAAKTLANEYKNFTESEVSSRGPFKFKGQAYYMLEHEDRHPELGVGTPEVVDPASVFDVEKGPYCDNFTEFHEYLHGKYAPASKK